MPNPTSTSPANLGNGDLSFLFDEVVRTIDFPIILSDANNNPIYSKNLDRHA